MIAELNRHIPLPPLYFHLAHRHRSAMIVIVSVAVMTIQTVIETAIDTEHPRKAKGLLPLPSPFSRRKYSERDMDRDYRSNRDGKWPSRDRGGDRERDSGGRGRERDDEMYVCMCVRLSKCIYAVFPVICK